MVVVVVVSSTLQSVLLLVLLFVHKTEVIESGSNTPLLLYCCSVTHKTEDIRIRHPAKIFYTSVSSTSTTTQQMYSGHAVVNMILV